MSLIVLVNDSVRYITVEEEINLAAVSLAQGLAVEHFRGFSVQKEALVKTGDLVAIFRHQADIV